MAKTIGYYTESNAAKAIGQYFGYYGEKLTPEQLRAAIALCASLSFEMFVDIEENFLSSHPNPQNGLLVNIISQANQDERLNLLPFLVDALTNPTRKV